jgi:hypothetical protein
MSDDEMGEIKDELAEYKRQLDVLREDFKLLIKHSVNAKNSMLHTSNQRDVHGFDKADIERCSAFVKKYEISI